MGILKEVNMARKKDIKPEKFPVRIPTAKPTIWHDDKSKYNRRKAKEKARKEKEGYE